MYHVDLGRITAIYKIVNGKIFPILGKHGMYLFAIDEYTFDVAFRSEFASINLRAKAEKLVGGVLLFLQLTKRNHSSIKVVFM
jgi:hypothetical protein